MVRQTLPVDVFLIGAVTEVPSDLSVVFIMSLEILVWHRHLIAPRTPAAALPLPPPRYAVSMSDFDQTIAPIPHQFFLAFGVTLVISYHAIQGKSPDNGGVHEQMATDLGVCEAGGSICGMPGRCCSGF
jgi:hypothetical protein